MRKANTTTSGTHAGSSGTADRVRWGLRSTRSGSEQGWSAVPTGGVRAGTRLGALRTGALRAGAVRLGALRTGAVLSMVALFGSTSGVAAQAEVSQPGATSESLTSSAPASYTASAFAAARTSLPTAARQPAADPLVPALTANGVMNYAVIFEPGAKDTLEAVTQGVATRKGFMLTSYPDLGVAFIQLRGENAATWLQDVAGVSEWGPTRQDPVPDRENLYVTGAPSQTPTATGSPSTTPTNSPTNTPTNSPTNSPSTTPSADPTINPTFTPGTTPGTTPVNPTKEVPSSFPTVSKVASVRNNHVAKDPVGWGFDLINAGAAQKITQGSADITVGVMDTGVDITNPNLARRIDASRSVGCTTNGIANTAPAAWAPTRKADGSLGSGSVHGTHVAGIIGAEHSDSASNSVSGIAPKTSLVSIATGNGDGWFYPEYVVCGYQWAMEHKVNVLNHSYFVDPWMYWCTDQKSQAAGLEAVKRVVAAANRANVVSVVAAGNERTDLAQKTSDATSPNDSLAGPTTRPLSADCLDLPTELPGVISVSALAETTDVKTANLANFSNFGKDKITVTAPGSNIVSTGLGNTSISLSGTSMAAPFVSGVVALILAEKPTATLAEVTKILKDSSHGVDCPTAVCTGTETNNSFFGAGVVDAETAVNLAQGKTHAGDSTTSASPSASAQPNSQPSGEPSAAAATQEQGSQNTMFFVLAGVVALLIVGGTAVIAVRMKRKQP